MRRLALLLLPLLSVMLLGGCAGGLALSRMRTERVETFRSDRIGIGYIEGTLEITFDNRNKKNITFDRGRIEVKLDDRPLGVATLTAPTVVAPGRQRVSLPIRIRLAQEGLATIVKTLFTRPQELTENPDIRIAGTLELLTGTSTRSRKVRFDRRLDRRTAERIGDLWHRLY